MEDYKTFWEACATANEGDALVCKVKGYQRIIKNSNDAFLWEESWKRVELVGEFMLMKWRVEPE